MKDTRILPQGAGPLFDSTEAGRRNRDEALERVERAADEEWKERAWAYLNRMAKAQPEFCAEDLWLAGLDKPREPRALGPLLMHARRDGLIAPSGRYRQSASASRNSGDAKVWLSLVHRP